MKKIIFALIILIGVSSSCTKNFEDFNTDKKNPTEVPGGFLFANAQKAFSDQVASTNVNLNVFKLFAQYWTETTYTDESNYDIINRTIPDLTFRTWYRDVLSDLADAKKLITAEAAEGTDATKAKDNKLAIIDIMEVFVYQRLVDIFGNVPYTEAIDIDNIAPKYDDAFAIYQDLLARLNDDIAGLDAGFDSFGVDDVFFGGDVSMWIKFANTLKVRMGVNLMDYNSDVAKAAIESGFSGAFAEGEICEVHYDEIQTNPLYQDLVQSGRDDFVATNTIVDIMNDLNDPRRYAYFDTNLDGDVFVGGIYGESNAFAQFTHIAKPIQAPAYPMTILDYTELCFYLAEAASNGYSVGGSAESWYNKGILSSMAHWGVSETDANAYLASAGVAWGSAAGSDKEKIAVQEWLSFYLRGLEGWTTWRRLDAPAMNLPPAPETDDGQVPKRFTYPVNEQTLNRDNYYSAADAIGGDLMSTKVFWDKH